MLCSVRALLIESFINDVSGDTFDVSAGEAVACEHFRGSLNFIVNLTLVAAAGEGSSDESCYG